MKNISKIYIGVDISKNTLDISIYPLRKSLKIKNSVDEISAFIAELPKYDVAQIACESTGGYESLLNNLLQKNGYNLWIVDPRRIKAFIIADGCKRKTDKVDAQKIAEFAFKNFPNYEKITATQNQEILLSLVNRKQDLTKFLASEKTRTDHPSHAIHAQSIKKVIKFLEKAIELIDKEIQNLITKDNDLNAKSKFLESIPGIGKATSAILLSSVPELGSLSNNKISALIGVCPYENESGNYKGKKSIMGGRAFPRNALYMCALTTIKYHLPLKSFYDRLIKKGKPFKVAIVAIMRKLIVIANSILKRGELCRA